MTPQLFAACLMLAANTYQVPPGVLLGIMQVEGGRIGQQVLNNNGSYDLGPMQINTIWMPELARHWNVDRQTAHKWVRDDGCVNVGVSAWILRQKINQTGSLYHGIAWYHSATPQFGQVYARKVVKAMSGMNLLKKANHAKTKTRSVQAGMKVTRVEDQGRVLERRPGSG